MKILIVSGSFYPDNTPRAFRTTELVKQFCRLNHAVTICIPYTESDLSEFVNKYPVKVKYYTRDRIRSVGGLVSKIRNRLLAQFLEYPDIKIVGQLKTMLRTESGYDLLLTIAQPHPIHWTVGLLYRSGHKIAKTWVADCGDPYMLCDVKRLKKPFYFKYIEKLWCRECDNITVPTEASIAGYYLEFKHKIRVIPQAFDFSEVKRKKYVKNDIPTFAFSGNLIPHIRDPKPLLEYLAALNIDFKFIFYTTKRHLILPYQKLMPSKIEIHDYIPRLDLLYVLSGMDFLVNIENATQVQTPSKLIDYGLTGRPILSVNSNKLDVSVIDEFLRGDYSHQYLISDMNVYNIVNVANQFLELANR